MLGLSNVVLMFGTTSSLFQRRNLTPYNKRMNPFIRRVAEDMQVRNFSPNTIDSYTFHVDKFCQYFGKPADELGPEQIRQFQLHLRPFHSPQSPVSFSKHPNDRGRNCFGATVRRVRSGTRNCSRQITGGFGRRPAVRVRSTGTWKCG